jgi:hypothetical protein
MAIGFPRNRPTVDATTEGSPVFTISSSFRGRVLAPAVSGALLSGGGGALAAAPAAAADTTVTKGTGIGGIVDDD